MKIARRFNAGIRIGKRMSPEGTTDRRHVLRELWDWFSRPFGTCISDSNNPALKRRAIIAGPFGTMPWCCSSSRRDERK